QGKISGIVENACLLQACLKDTSVPFDLEFFITIDSEPSVEFSAGIGQTMMTSTWKFLSYALPFRWSQVALGLKNSGGYTRFKTDTPAGTQETNIPAGTQAQDSDSDVEEQVIVVPSFPSNSFAGPSSSNGPSVMERNADYAEELAKLQRQEYEAKDAAARYGYLFSQATTEILSQAEAEIRNQGVSADRDPAGIDFAGGVSAGSTSAGSDPAGGNSAGIDSAGGVSAGSTSAGSDPAGGNPAGSFPPAGSYEPAGEGNPAVSTSVSADFIPVHAVESTLPLGQSLGSTPAVEVNPVPTKRVNTIHPQSQILGDLASPVLVKVLSLDIFKINKGPIIQTNFIVCLLASFLS
ncbi:hypothetical protein Tco_1049768, partial [Tanacetum coccineum]